MKINDFDLSKIIKSICEIDQKQYFQQNIQLFLVRTTKIKTEIYKQEADDDTKKILFEVIKKEITNARFSNRDIMEYDPVISKRNTHEIVYVPEYDNISKKLSEFADESKWLISTRGLNESKFQYWMASIQDGEDNYKFIGSYSNILQLQKKYLFGFVSKGNLDNSKIKFSDENNIFGFGKKVEIIVVNNKYIIINSAESKFENIFKMDKLFSDQAIALLKENEKLKQVFSEETRGKISKKAKNGKRIATRLIKIVSDSETFHKTIENISELDTIINDPTHKFHDQVKNVTFSKGILSVIEGQEIQLINAISDAWVEPVISKVQRQDEARM